MTLSEVSNISFRGNHAALKNQHKTYKRPHQKANCTGKKLALALTAMGSIALAGVLIYKNRGGITKMLPQGTKKFAAGTSTPPKSTPIPPKSTPSTDNITKFFDKQGNEVLNITFDKGVAKTAQKEPFSGVLKKAKLMLNILKDYQQKPE